MAELLGAPLTEVLAAEAAMALEASARAALPPYLTTAELAVLTRTPIETVRYWRHIGKGPDSFKLGRRVLYAAEAVEAWLAEARKVGSAA